MGIMEHGEGEATEKIYYNFTKVETWNANGGFIWPVLKLLSSCGT